MKHQSLGGKAQMKPKFVIVVEDDPFTRLIQVVLDPTTSPERLSAFADFMAHDEPNFVEWARRLRTQASLLDPADVRMVSSLAEMRANLADCHALVIESMPLTAQDLRVAPKLRVVQKFGNTVRNIDIEAVAKAGISLLRLRRKANIACAESVFAMILALARRLHEMHGLISVEQLAAAGYPYRKFDRRHTPGGNYGRISGLRMLYGSTIGILGMGEIGREVAMRATAFGMRVIYHQRTRLPPIEEGELSATYVPLQTLLSESDWVVPQLPGGPSTRHLIGRNELAQIKQGSCIVNVSNPDVIERDAVIEALRSGRLGGFALDVLYEEPGRSDDELLEFNNVLLMPHLAGSPRSNGLSDFEKLILGLAKALE